MSRDVDKYPNPFPIEQKLMDVLKDGEAHSVDKLKLCLSDGEHSSTVALAKQVNNLRKVLNRRGMDVVCQWVKGATCYRMVRYLNTEE